MLVALEQVPLRRRGALLAAMAAFVGHAQAAVLVDGLPPDRVRALLADEVDAGRSSVGMMAGLLDRSGCTLVGYGRADDTGERVLDGDTVFEIGSITKVFTALLLADMAARGEVALTDPVAKYLPANVRLHEPDGRPVTLVDLATHTSGLPLRPDNLAPKNPANPYADFTVDQLYAFLSTYQSPFPPGTHYMYSNLGFGLLGHVLALRAGCDYEELMVKRICAPLGLDSTRITLTPSMQARMAAGHDHPRAPGRPPRSRDRSRAPGELRGSLRTHAQDGDHGE